MSYGYRKIPLLQKRLAKTRFQSRKRLFIFSCILSNYAYLAKIINPAIFPENFLRKITSFNFEYKGRIKFDD